MFATAPVWENRFDRIANILQWMALAFGALFAFVQDGATLSTATAFTVVALYIVVFQSLPMRIRHGLWTGEILAVTGVGLAMLAVAITGGVDSPYLLFSITPVLYSAAFAGWRRGIETALLAAAVLMAIQSLSGDNSLAEDGLWAWVAIYLLIAVTFSFARHLLLEASETNAALLAASAAAREQLDRLDRLDASHKLLTALSELADGTELNPVSVGEAALSHLESVISFRAGQIAIAGPDGPVVVARLSVPTEHEHTLSRPLTVGARNVGAVILARDEPFQADDMRGLEETLQSVALSFANILLLQDIARRAIQEERVRLARELHDEIGPSLASLGLSLDMAILQSQDDSELTEHLGGLRSNVTNLVEEVRDTVAGLRETQPISLHEQAVTLCAEEPDQLPKVTTALREHRPPPVEIGAEITSIMSEAVRNARRHAGAHMVTIAGYVNHDSGEVSVTDDGAGFDIKRNFKGHYGLIGMRERAEKIGARLDVRSSPVGTTVTVRWGTS
ncbi:MAG: sensor histidine kinase [Acidimicrobiia bacterium]